MVKSVSDGAFSGGVYSIKACMSKEFLTILQYQFQILPEESKLVLHLKIEIFHPPRSLDRVTFLSGVPSPFCT